MRAARIRDQGYRWVGWKAVSMASDSSKSKDRISIGRIPLKQVRVARPDKEPKESEANPMNRLVPYLDLFMRLEDEELARLASVNVDVCAALRTQVVAICDGLAPYVDLLPRLNDAELVRLTGAADKTIRFWRLCQPRASTLKAAAPKPEPKPEPEPQRVVEADDGVPSESLSSRDVETGAFPEAHRDSAIPTPPPQGPRTPSGSHVSVAATRQTDTSTGRFPSTAALSPSDSVTAGMMELSGDPFPGYETDPGSLTVDEIDECVDPIGIVE